MRPRDVAKRVGVSALVFLLVLAGGTAFTGAGTTDTPVAETMPVDAYSSDELVASVPEATGEIEVTADASGDVVLIDASHGGSMDRDQLSPLVETLTANGAEVRFLSSERDGRPNPGDESAFNGSLREADAFIAFGAEQGYTEGQVDGLEAFADAGGRVLLAKDPPQMQQSVIVLGPRQPQGEVPMPFAPLASRFGIGFGNGYLYNMHEYDTNYRNVYATPVDTGGLTADVDRLVLHEATPVRGPTTHVRTIERTELSETRERDRYGVVVQSGNVVAIGDSSVLGQEYVKRGDNEEFVGNLLDFLVSAEKNPENAPASPAPPDEGNTTRQPPTRPVPR